jgi:hypothetical protein
MTEAHLISYQPGVDERILNWEGSVSREDSYFQVRTTFNSGCNLSRNEPPLSADFVAKVVFLVS